jgi:hypothetical protein
MASIVSAGITIATALNMSGDTSGVLQLASNNAVTAVTIDASQNVGIGTASPAGRLDSYGDSTNPAGIFRRGGAYGNIESSDIARANRWTIGRDNASTGNFVIAYNDSTKTSIDTSGNVGIGTTSPSTKLQVAIGNVSTFGQVSNAGLAITGAGTTGNYAQIGLGYAGTNQPAAIGYVTVIQTGYTYGDIVFGTRSVNTDTAPTERMRINSSGQLVMATSTYGLVGQLQVGITASTSGMNSLLSVAGDQNGGYPIGSRGNSSTQGLIGFFDSSNSTIGSITKSGSSVAYNTSSDYRLKENIAPMTGALAKVTQLKPVTYKWKSDGTDGEGFIAHELAEVCPSAVYGEKDAVDADGNPKYQGIDTSFLVATLTAAIQEQQVIINALTARLEALETA